MKRLDEEFAEIGVAIPTILLPRPEIDMTKWAVIACDQYTSQPEYWQNVRNFVGDAPSTLKMTFPEIYLEDRDAGDRIAQIHQTMSEYLKEGILVPQSPGFIYVERKCPSKANLRKGLIVAVDLEKYDYNKGSKSLIRATEGTILDRLPPRIKVREKAPLELPHIMVLIDDPDKTVIEPLSDLSTSLAKLYDFDLMMGGGHITGYKIDGQKLLQNISEAIKRLVNPETLISKYGIQNDPLLFAVGDGNHSLATAKAVWENIKRQTGEDVTARQEIMKHPARYALVELVNLYDEGLHFEPIHRVLFNVDANNVLAELKSYYDCSIQYVPDVSVMTQTVNELTNKHPNIHSFGYISNGDVGVITVRHTRSNLPVCTLQEFLDSYLKKNPRVKIDYIHGDEVVCSLASKEGNMGFFLPAMDKKELFPTVMLDGALPRKTFSMGEADEKRYYLECRKIL